MTRPTESSDDRDLHAVQDAYRALPPAEPGAALDARVRAAIAAELANTAAKDVADAPARPAAAKVIVFPWWRRASLPLAAAATVMLAVGIGRFWFVGGGYEDAPGSVTDAPPAAVAPAAQPASPAQDGATPAADARVSESESESGQNRHRPQADQASTLKSPEAFPKKQPGPPPAEDMATQRKAEPVEPAAANTQEGLDAAAQAERPEHERKAAARSAETARQAVAAPAPSPAAEVPAAKASAPTAPAAGAAARGAGSDAAAPGDTATFDEIRRLLREQRHDEARALLKRWRDTHPDVTPPEDLRALAAELDRAP